jgi:pimeloyl-ACP methyl ester carboxylesterase
MSALAAGYKTAVRGGVALRYTDTGAGDPPLLFIHGWCCDQTHWRGQLPVFSRDHRVVALDLRGHGASDKPDQDYTIDGFVDDAAWLTAELGLERPVIAGHSMGGVIALNFVRKHPEAARAAVMADAPAVPVPGNLRPMVDNLLAGLQTPAYSQIAEAFARTMFNEASPPGLPDEVAPRMARAPQRLMYTALQSTLSPAAIEPGPLPVPALFVRAATAFDSEDEIRGRYPGAQVVTLEAAHFLQMEKPAEFNERLMKFLRSLP